MSHIISIVNQKGGVGKTTTAVNLASSLAVMEKKVLLLDTDPQANASSGIGFEVNEELVNIYDCMTKEQNIKDAIYKTQVPNLDIITSDINLIGAEIELVNLSEREYKIKQLLNEIEHLYDYIIIDCSPSLGLITVNALTASNSVIVPVQAEYYALEGLGKLLNTIKIIQSNLNPELTILGVLITIYDPRLRLANEVLLEVKQHFENLIFETVIQRNIRLSEAPGYGKPIILYDAKSRGSENYLNLASEVENRLNNIEQNESIAK